MKSVTWESYTNAVDASERRFELFYHVHKRISSQSVDIVKFAATSMKHLTDVPREIGPELGRQEIQSHFVPSDAVGCMG